MADTSSGRALVFGATGAIGSAIAARFVDEGWHVTGVSRHGSASPRHGIVEMQYDPLTADGAAHAALADAGPFDAVVWAQGANAADTVRTVEIEAHEALYRANCVYILVSLRELLQRGALAPQARLCVISSIWQKLARQNKLSYCMTKAALQGLVMAASADLAEEGILINALLPGALDTPMTRRNVAPEQLDRLRAATGFNRLPDVGDVSQMAYFLCSPANTGITGQFIAVDLGFSHVRLL